MVDVESVASYLLDRGLLDPSWIIGGDLIIRRIARRNRNLRIEGPDGSGLFLKQPDPSVRGGRESLLHEAAILRMCGSDPDLAPFREFVPRQVAFDPPGPILILELIADAVGLASLLEDPDGLDVAAEVAFRLGSGLGLLHRRSRASLRGGAAAWLPDHPPWVMGLRRPDISWLAELSPAGAEVLRILRNDPTFATRFEPMATRWRAESLIHGDVRLDNILIRTGGPAGPRIWIADWEMAQIGDPAWDLAGALQDLLVHWVGTMPLSEGLAPTDWVSRARLPLDAVRRAARALWSGYREAAAPSPGEANDLASRAVAYSAARLVQSAYEAAAEADRLPAVSVILMQLGANVLAEPERARVQLYGLIPGGPRS
jgi:hypothetical protein